jgi:hypothetical protein
MFDEVTCEYALPDAFDARGVLFQAKELDNFLERYTITSDGRLIAHRVRYEDVPEEERPYYGTPEWSTSPWLQCCGCLRTVPAGDEEIMFHGDVRLYQSNICMSGPEGFATVDDAPVDIREYIVRFTNGRVEWIRGGSVPQRGQQLTREAMQRAWDERQVPEGGLRVATPDALFD